MEVLNATGLTLVSAQMPSSSTSERKWETRKPFSLPSVSLPKLLSPPGLSGGLVLVTNLLGSSGLAKALTYEEALQQSVSPLGPSADFDVGGLIDGLVSFGTENPIVVAGGIAALAVPLVLSQVLKKPKPWGIESASNAYAKLSDDASSQLLDVRGRQNFKEIGSPDIRGLKKKPVSITYDGDNKPGFIKKLSLKFKEPENTTLFVLDKFEGNSELVAELVTLNGFKAAYAIKDGAEGPRGWMKSGLPWLPPKKTFSFDFSELKDAFSGAAGDDSEALTLTLGIAAATGLGVLAFTEVETVLQLLGLAALLQFVNKKILFAEDRKQTLKQVDEFFTTEVAPGELLDEFKMIGKALRPAPVNGNALLPAPTEESQAPVEKTEEAAVLTAAVKAEAAVEPPTTQVNSVTKAEVKEESIPGLQRPLSPFPYYPDFKPPTSPSPSQP